MATAQERLDKWTERYAGTSKPACVTENMKTAMIAKMTDVFTEQVAVEDAVKVIMAEAATPIILNGYYHAFGKQVASLQNRTTGAQLLATVDVYLNVWVGRGLDRDILERVRNSVFALAAPTP